MIKGGPPTRIALLRILLFPQIEKCDNERIDNQKRDHKYRKVHR